MQIKVNKLTKIFNKKSLLEHTAVQDASFSVKQGEYIGIIGPTGSGKTTFVEHLNALSTPDKGIIEWRFNAQGKFSKRKAKKYDIKDWRNRHEEYWYVENIVFDAAKNRRFKKIKQIRKRVGVVFQFAEYQLFEETVLKDVAFGARAFGASKEEANAKAKTYLEMVGMPEEFWNRSPFGLSGGQKRRVALAGILAIEPEVLIFDEPTAGLDPAGVIDILNIFDKLNQKGKTIIMITHDLDNILEHTKRTVMFNKGKIVYDGDTYELLKDTKFLYENNMQPPRILEFVSKLEARGLKVPRVVDEKELIDFLNTHMAKRGGHEK
ncbi:cobalt ABC transporter ATP-binding protein [Mycoplasmopsis californica]|uniref:ATP-binding cassette domain-containing protein n=1 Tax=Mycoplasmopsis equigenitalium TaxID=114883 RepID=A0ABY5J5P7_9BACT|nr:ATP-binding cassette domain-containing protein [Mycoplasmopsis equigenitalium]UUD37013.1 ATP-binding cassette domain-containing protein [Mycoplasmopsis equigenitalium]VEU69688.1 cobalt ABC transporter ATP-binding protein [Mycoplasmopsis californica]